MGEAGAWHRDEIREITGNVTEVCERIFGLRGSFNLIKNSQETALPGASGSGFYKAAVDYRASYQVPTGPENVPQHIIQPLIVYLGLPV